MQVAAVATGFPSGQYPTDLKVADARSAVELGADEVDMVIDRGAFLSGRYAKVYDEIVQVKEAVGDAHLKVILETGELGTYDNVRRASLLAMAARRRLHQDVDRQDPERRDAAGRALHARGDPRRPRGDGPRASASRPAGGVRVAKKAIQHLVLVHETLGPDWLTPDRYRIGASSLLNDILMQIRKERTGRYQGPDYFTLD